jgi:hypothetical protein
VNKQVKRKWVKALRSGKIPQGYNRLADGPARCCMGVLRDLMGWDDEKDDALNISHERVMSVGLDRIIAIKLASMNDGNDIKTGEGNIGKRKSFRQIAAYIERYL